MPVRVVVCYSSELYRQKAETLGIIAKREASRCARICGKIQRKTFACAEDAQAEADRLRDQQPFITQTLSAQVVEHQIKAKRLHQGRPGKDEPKPVVTLRYRLVITTSFASKSELAERLRRASIYVIVRHRVAGWIIADEEMLDNYARQWRCESGFSWLKSQAAINPMFVQSPRRIASLCFIYCIALMLHTIIQRNIRRYLHEHHLGLPYRRNKPSPDITARFFYELFRGMSSQTISLQGRLEKRIFGGDEWTALALKAVGASEKAYKPKLGKVPTKGAK